MSEEEVEHYRFLMEYYKEGKLKRAEVASLMGVGYRQAGRLLQCLEHEGKKGLISRKL